MQIVGFLMRRLIYLSDNAEKSDLTRSNKHYKPALVDVQQQEPLKRYFKTSQIMETGYSASQNQHIFDSSTHVILWYNHYYTPAVISIDNWNNRFEGCSYTNCVFTTDKAMLRKSSAIIFEVTARDMGKTPPLTEKERPKDQVWIFSGWESPWGHQWNPDFMSPAWRGVLNWSMYYRLDSDILLPYGFLRTRQFVPARNYSEIFNRKTKFGVWIASHCGATSKRDAFVSILQSYGLPIDIYGKCGTALDQDPSQMINETYKFYFALENSLCIDYVTEKFFHHFPLDAVLVVRGGADYSKLLPSDAFIDSSRFPSISDLAKYLFMVNSNEELYTEYLNNKDRYQVDNIYEKNIRMASYNRWDVYYTENNTFTLPICQLCHKLNNKADNRRVYEDIVDYIYTDTCHEPKDVWTISLGLTTTIFCILGSSTALVYIVYFVKSYRLKPFSNINITR